MGLDDLVSKGKHALEGHEQEAADALDKAADAIKSHTGDGTDDVTEATFRRLVDGRELRGAIARDGAGDAVGIVHWLSHPATWSIAPYTYLEDLFVAPDARGTGAGRALIDHVVAWAREAGHVKVYWLTKADNRTARALYDRVATDTGFVHYQVATA